MRDKDHALPGEDLDIFKDWKNRFVAPGETVTRARAHFNEIYGKDIQRVASEQADALKHRLDPSMRYGWVLPDGKFLPNLNGAIHADTYGKVLKATPHLDGGFDYDHPTGQFVRNEVDSSDAWYHTALHHLGWIRTGGSGRHTYIHAGQHPPTPEQVQFFRDNPHLFHEDTKVEVEPFEKASWDDKLHPVGTEGFLNAYNRPVPKHRSRLIEFLPDHIRERYELSEMADFKRPDVYDESIWSQPRKVYSNYDRLNELQAREGEKLWDHPEYQEITKRNRDWQKSAYAAVSAGLLTPEQAYELDHGRPPGHSERAWDQEANDHVFYDGGHYSGHTEHIGTHEGQPIFHKYGLHKIPEDHDLYHVSVNHPSVEKHGLYPKDDVRQQGGTEGIGGGDGGAISFTHDPQYAHDMARSLVAFKNLKNGGSFDEFLQTMSAPGTDLDAMREHLAGGIHGALYGGRSNPHIGEAIHEALKTNSDASFDTSEFDRLVRGQPANTTIPIEQLRDTAIRAIGFTAPTFGGPSYVAPWGDLDRLKDAKVGVFKTKAKPGARGTYHPAESEWRLFHPDAFEKPELVWHEGISSIPPTKLSEGPTKEPWEMTAKEYRQQRPLPPMERLPETGNYAYIKTDDGSIYFGDDNSHVMLANRLGIPKERIESGGFIDDGVISSSGASSANIESLVRQEQAKVAIARKKVIEQAFREGKLTSERARELGHFNDYPDLAVKYGKTDSKFSEVHPNVLEWHKDSHEFTKNKDGTPKVFYHGAYQSGFDTFDPSLGEHGDGIWVVNDPHEASFFANLGHKGKSGGQGVYPVHIHLKNPYIAQVNELGDWDKHYGGVIPKKFVHDADKQSELISKARALGHDSIIVRNLWEGYYPAQYTGDQVMVFHPHQIKSVFNQNPTDHPNILLAEHPDRIEYEHVPNAYTGEDRYDDMDEAPYSDLDGASHHTIYANHNGERIGYVRMVDLSKVNPKDLESYHNDNYGHLFDAEGGEDLRNELASTPALYNYDMHLHPSYRGRGIGKQMLLQLFDVAKSLGHSEIHRDVRGMTPEGRRTWMAARDEAGDDFKVHLSEHQPIRDHSGQPITLYHGTTKPEFSTFKRTDPTPQDWVLFDRHLGTHLAYDPEVANSFTHRHGDVQPGAHVYPVQAMARKVYDLPQTYHNPHYGKEVHETDQEAFLRDAFRHTVDHDPELFADLAVAVRGGDRGEWLDKFHKLKSGVYDDARDLESLDMYGYDHTPGNVLKGYITSGLYNVPHETKLAVLNGYRESLKAKGYDAIRYHNTSPMEMRGASDPRCLVVLHPEKHIKSAFNPTPNPKVEGLNLAEVHPNVLEWHKDSHPLTKNEDGTPKVFYHGSITPGFDTFDLNKGKSLDHGFYTRGFYVAHNVDLVNDTYVDSSRATGHGIYPVHIHMANPYTGPGYLEHREAQGLDTDYWTDEYKEGITRFTEDLIAQGFDGYINKEEACVFHPHQIKSVFNQNPTDHLNILLSEFATKPNYDDHFEGWPDAATVSNAKVAPVDLSYGGTNHTWKLNHEGNDYFVKGEGERAPGNDSRDAIIEEHAARLGHMIGIGHLFMPTKAINGSVVMKHFAPHQTSMYGLKASQRADAYRSNSDDVMRGMVFDYLIGNDDRHGGNVGYDKKTKKMFLIDHSLSGVSYPAGHLASWRLMENVLHSYAREEDPVPNDIFESITENSSNIRKLIRSDRAESGDRYESFGGPHIEKRLRRLVEFASHLKRHGSLPYSEFTEFMLNPDYFKERQNTPVITLAERFEPSTPQYRGVFSQNGGVNYHPEFHKTFDTWPSHDEFDEMERKTASTVILGVNDNTMVHHEPTGRAFLIKRHHGTGGSLGGHAEQFAAHVAHQLGIQGHVPPSRAGLSPEISHTLMVPHNEGIYHLNSEYDAHTVGKHLLFDYLIGNADRNAGNRLFLSRVNAPHHVWLIDHSHIVSPVAGDIAMSQMFRLHHGASVKSFVGDKVLSDYDNVPLKDLFPIGGKHAQALHDLGEHYIPQFLNADHNGGVNRAMYRERVRHVENGAWLGKSLGEFIRHSMDSTTLRRWHNLYSDIVNHHGIGTKDISKIPHIDLW